MMASAEEERAIIALINRYATGLDTADWALLRSCWADEVDVDYGTGETWSSGDALNEFMERFHTGLITMHMNGNYTIEDTGPDRARGRTYYKAILLKGDGSPFMRADGWYDDEFEKIAGEWKITKRTSRMIDIEQAG
jgi:hypothetical protein